MMTKISNFFFIFFCLIFFVSCNVSDKQTNDYQTETNLPDSTSTTLPTEVKTILFFGNSLTAGYGLEQAEAFPALIQTKIDALKMPYKVINAGLSGETTAGGNTRIEWILNQKIDILIIELGGNDGLRGISPDLTYANLQSIINKAKAKYPDLKIILAGMEAPPNMGEKFTADFRKIYKELADKNQVSLIPFLLETVGGDPKLNLPDGIHPTAQGHQIVAETVWKTLKVVIDAQ